MSFAATWEYGGEVSWITVSVTAGDAGHTRFELEHVAHVKDEFWDEFGPGATGIGWDLGLLGLELHLVDPSAARVDEATFGASDDGRRFVSESGEAWYAAAVASGLDEPAQRAAADRSIAAYTATPP